MRTVVITKSVDDDELARMREPKTTPVLEVALDDGSFGLGEGPFHHYHRALEVDPVPTPDGRFHVVETTDFELAVPIWGPMFNLFMKGSIKRPPAPGKVPWWVPPGQMDARATEVLSYLCVFACITGYLGVMLGQLNPYFKIEFGSELSEIADVQIAVRIGAFLALGVVAFADRLGRKRMLLIATYLGTTLAATGAFAPNLGWLGVSQGVARAFSAAIFLIVMVMAAEEMPAGARAFAVSVIAMASALGAGGVVLFLGLADVSTGAWRVFFVVPVIFVIPARLIGRRLPETKRYELLEKRRADDAAEEEQGLADHDADAPDGRRSERWRRFAMVGFAGLFINVFVIPVGANLNEFLKTEQGFAGWQIAVFQVMTNLPGGAAIIIGGRLADRYGRRIIGSIGVTGLAVFTTLMFLSSGWLIWVFSALATLTGALVIPALGVYQSELFPTDSRGKANGGINLMNVIGSVIGLKAAGLLAENYFDDRLGPAIAVLAVGPLIVVAIVLLFFPETVHKELEELNPEDLPPPAGAELVALDEWHRQHEAETHAHHPHHPHLPLSGILGHHEPTDGDGEGHADADADAEPPGSTGSISPRA